MAGWSKDISPFGVAIYQCRENHFSNVDHDIEARPESTMELEREKPSLMLAFDGWSRKSNTFGKKRYAISYGNTDPSKL